MSNHKDTPEQRPTELFSPAELAEFGSPTPLQDTQAMTTALGGIGLGDAGAEGLPLGSQNRATSPLEIEEALRALRKVWQNKQHTRADIASALSISENQVAQTQSEWQDRPSEIVYVGDNLDLLSLRSGKGLVLPEFVGGNVGFYSLEAGEGLILPRYVGGCIGFENLPSIKNIKLPEHIDGLLFLDSLSSSEGLAEALASLTGTISLSRRFENEVTQIQKTNPQLVVKWVSYHG